MKPALGGVAVCLGLAAAPTFAVMAVATGLYEPRGGAAFCGPVPGGSPLGDMGVMYLLMGAFHLGPWLRLAASRSTPSH